MFQFLIYKITDHRTFIPGLSPMNPFSPNSIQLPRMNQSSIPANISMIIFNNPIILRNKLFTAHHPTIITRNTSFFTYNKSIRSTNKTFIPEYNSEIFGSAIVILRNKLFIPENNSPEPNQDIFLFGTKQLFRLNQPLPSGK